MVNDFVYATVEYAWLKDATAATLTQTLIDQDKAFKNFFEGRAAYPKFSLVTDSVDV